MFANLCFPPFRKLLPIIILKSDFLIENLLRHSFFVLFQQGFLFGELLYFIINSSEEGGYFLLLWEGGKEYLNIS